MRRCMVCVALLTILAVSGCATTQKGETPETAEPAGQTSRLTRLAADLEQRGATDTAIALYEQAASAPGAPASAFVGLGDIYMRSGYPDEAVKSYQAALSRSPGYGPALVGFGWAMVRSGDTEAGIRTLAEGARSVNTSKAYNRLGVAQTFAGQIQPALDTFSRARSLAPDDPDIRINIALAAALADDSATALPIVQQLAASQNTSLHHRRNIVMVYGLLGRANEAHALQLTGLSTVEVNKLLAAAGSIRAKPTVAARAQALGSMNG